MQEELLLAGLDEVLDGLGAPQKNQIKLKVGQITKAVAERAKVVPAEIQRFATRVDRMTDEQKRSWKANEAEPTTHHKYRIVKLTSVGKDYTELLSLDQSKLPGVTNFKDQVMDPLEVGLIDRIGLSFAIDPTNAVTDGYKLNFSNYAVAWDDLANGELQVKLGKTPILDEFPIRNFLVTESGAAPTTMDPRNFYARVPIDKALWHDKVNLSIGLRFGANTVVPAGSAVWVRIDIICGGIKAV